MMLLVGSLTAAYSFENCCNFDLKRSDGTTAAQRLFGRQFPNLFAWVMERMGELPRPRISKKSVKSTTLTLQSVPA